MPRRQRMSRRRSRKVFRRGAKRVNRRNRISGRPMRGGIRL